MIERRTFLVGAAGAAALLPAALKAQGSAAFGTQRLLDTIREIDRESRGRFGIAVLDKASGARFAWRGEERFAMCSTFKFLVAAATLHRVDRRQERLDRRLPVRRSDLVAYSPVTQRLVGRGATVARLCEATMTMSDNAAANLLLASLGGPPGLTRFVRGTGDPATRLDRIEPILNEARPGDPRDTTTPTAMTDTLDRFVFGDVLRPASRQMLLRWLVDNRTGNNRIRAGVPAGWRVGDKTGTSDRGSVNDIGIIFPPGRAPLLLSIYIAESTLATRDAERLHERATRAVIAAL